MLVYSICWCHLYLKRQRAAAYSHQAFEKIATCCERHVVSPSNSSRHAARQDDDAREPPPKAGDAVIVIAVATLTRRRQYPRLNIATMSRHAGGQESRKAFRADTQDEAYAQRALCAVLRCHASACITREARNMHTSKASRRLAILFTDVALRYILFSRGVIS